MSPLSGKKEKITLILRDEILDFFVEIAGKPSNLYT
jgi:hypothetical protein